LLSALGLTKDDARLITNLNKSVPRSLNAQASLTWLDLAAAADFVVLQSGSPPRA